MQYGMPTLIENTTLNDNILLCRELVEPGYVIQDCLDKMTATTLQLKYQIDNYRV